MLNAMERSVRIITHGCRLNQAESALLRDLFCEAGWSLAAENTPADLVVVNTCCVTGLAEAKCRQSIRQAINRNPNAFIAVIGCLPQAHTHDFTQWEGVDLIVGNDAKLKLPELVGPAKKNKKPVEICAPLARNDFKVPFMADPDPFPQRANLKVQDGCNFACAYCIIPKARGAPRSRDFDDALAEARTLAARGVRELVLTGVNIGKYANQGRDFLDLLDALAQIKGIDRLRISSIEPTTVPADGLFKRMRDNTHPLLPYLHLPIQSGSEKILERMRRRYTLREVLDFARHAAASVPEIGLGTDILVGHPGEGPDEFEQTCRSFLESPFQYAHVFSYSERPGTLSAKMPDAVPIAQRHRRSAILRALSAKKHRAWAKGFLEETVEVLFENPRPDYWPGLTGNFLRVIARDGRDLRNRLARVKLLRLCGDAVEGEVLEIL